VVGLDIGSHSVKLVHLLHGEEKYEVISCQEQEYAMIDGAGPTAAAGAIRKAFGRAGLKPGRGEDVITSVNGAGTAIKQVEFPILTDEELRSSIKWQASKRLPFGPEEAVLDYQVLSRDEEAKKMTVLLAAVTRAHLAEHLSLVKEAGIDPSIIDLSPLALANALMVTQDLKVNEAVVMLDLGSAKTILSVFSPRELFFTRDISIGGRLMTEGVQRHLNTSFEEAEKIKREGSAEQLLEILKEPLDQLIFEIRRSLTYYENRRGQRGFHMLYLAGGGAHLVQLAEHLHASLGVPVEKLNPFKGMESETSSEKLAEMAPRLALAVGLAARKVHRDHV
jgi:type IV pilus assembly protein PilM